MDVEAEINKLNRLFTLYTRTVKSKNAKPYRVWRLRNSMELALEEVAKNYEIVPIDAQNIVSYFSGSKGPLESIGREKVRAFKIGDFERILTLRVNEIRIVKNYLKEIGVPPNVFFFKFNNKIFKI